MSEVTIKIPALGREISGWSGLQIIRAIDSCADAFAFSVPWDPTPVNRSTFVAYLPYICEIRLDDELVITGRIESIGASYSAGSKTIEIQGRSLSGVLADWSAGPPFEFAEETPFNTIARQIARSVDGKFGAADRVTVTATPNVKVPAASIESPGASVYEFLSSLASAQGLWAQPRPDGSLLYSKISGRRAPVADLEEGAAPLISVDTVHDVTKRFYEYLVLQDSDGLFSEAKSIDTGVDNRIRGRKIIQPQQESADLSEAARFARARGLLDSYQCGVKVQGWRHNGRTWAPGDIIRVLAPSAMIYTTSRYIITRATLQLDESGGEVTALDLALPELYDGTDPQERPWAV